MTAEIAIINRTAVTLATDSAVTLQVRGSEKIYNCADKLFELSDLDPLGVMVYNNLEFMGIALEVAVKQFRKQIATVHYKSVNDAADAFFHFLEHDLKPDLPLQEQHIKAILHPLLVSIKDRFEKRASAAYRRRKNREKLDYPGMFSASVQEKITEAEKYDLAQCFEGIAESDIVSNFETAVTGLISEVFSDLPLEDAHRALLMRLCILYLLRDIYSEIHTGIVFAGFGEHDMFPSVIGFQIDGVIANRLKKRETDRVVTNRSEVTGEILPFAQREMVDRFMYGIDPEFEAGIERYLKTAVESSGNALVDSIPRVSKTTKTVLHKAVRAGTESALTVWRDRMLPTVKNKFMREVQDMIFLMPKPELAALAQELINLTSVKRKFSSGQESVGGPIDVAVISRIDGFVWVRRKHYFEPNLNPRYFHRKYGQSHT